MKQSQSQHDWKHVERQLQKSQEREEMRRFAKHDREQIRRKLAMEEDDVGDCKWPLNMLFILCAVSVFCGSGWAGCFVFEGRIVDYKMTLSCQPTLSVSG